MKKHLLFIIMLAGLCVVIPQLRAQPGSWSVSPSDFQFGMNILAQIETGGSVNNATDNHLAVFSGGEIRGYATPVQVGNQAYFFLNVYSNAYLNDTLYFLAFLEAEQRVYESADTVVFLHNQLIGSFGAPYIVHLQLSASPLIYSPTAIIYQEMNCTPEFVADLEASDDLDAEGAGLKYHITGGADAVRFTVDSLTGVLNWYNFLPDFENPEDADGNNIYLVQVRVSDSDGHQSARQITVTVTDSAPPEAQCPANLTAATGDDGAGNCSVDPAADLSVSVMADCSGFTVNYLMEGATTGQGIGQMPENQAFEKSLTTVTYTVLDDSGMPGSTCSFHVTVNDNEAPSLVCPADLTTVAAGCDMEVAGTGAIASDNCSFTLSYTMSGATSGSGDGQIPAAQLFAAGTTTVSYTVSDGVAPEASCSFSVDVEETEAPTIVCPANTTIQAGNFCKTPAPDYSTLAQADDNCTPPQSLVSTQQPAAGDTLTEAGPVAFTLTVTDLSGNSASCTFTVMIEDAAPLQITCPSAQTVCDGVLSDYTSIAAVTAGCQLAGAGLDVSQLPAAGASVAAFNSSEQVTLTVTAGAQTTSCTFQVTWVDPAPPQALCKNTTAYLDQSGAAAIDPEDIDNGSSDNCGIQSRVLSKTAFNCADAGSNTVTLTVTDVNGQTASCSATVVVSDTLPPQITCPDNLTVGHTADNPCSAQPVGIDAAYGDNCGSPSLTYALAGATTGSGSGSVSGLVFLTGATTVTYTVAGSGGQTAACSFVVTVTSCIVEFAGKIIWETDSNFGVKDVTLTLAGAASGSDLSDVNGDFGITTALGMGSFTLTPAKTANKLNGVNAADVTAIQQHVANIVPITNPYKLVAADVNKSNSVTVSDANVVAQVLLGNVPALTQFKTSWRFVPTNHPMLIPPWGFPEQRTYANINSGQYDQDFYGIKTGDVVAEFANPAALVAPEPLILVIEDQALDSGTEMYVDIRAGELADLIAFQFALRFDPSLLKLLGVEPLDGLPAGDYDLVLSNQMEGEARFIRAAVAGTKVKEGAGLFRLRFVVLADGGMLSEALGLAHDELPGQAYDSALELSDVYLQFLESTGVEQSGNMKGLSVECRPNPFTGRVAADVYLPEAGEVQARIFDVSGRMLAEQRNYCLPGRYSFTFDLPDTRGVLYCKVATSYGAITRKILATGN